MSLPTWDYTYCRPKKRFDYSCRFYQISYKNVYRGHNLKYISCSALNVSILLGILIWWYVPYSSLHTSKSAVQVWMGVVYKLWMFKSAMVHIFSWGERQDVPFNDGRAYSLVTNNTELISLILRFNSGPCVRPALGLNQATLGKEDYR